MNTFEVVFYSIGIFTMILGAIYGSLKSYGALYPIYKQWKDQKLLEDNFGRGPYDKSTIECSTKYYIRPKCSSTDPTQEAEIRHALTLPREELFRKINFFLDEDGPKHHLLILADSGTGKTSLLLNYYAYNLRRHKNERHRISIIPLGAKDADQLISNVPDHQNTNIFLDALDEDTKAIDDHIARTKTLLEACHSFRRVIITCRTQFFSKDEEIPVETGIVKLGPTRAGEKKEFELWKIYISPFGDDEVKAFLRKKYPIWAYRTRRKAQQITDKIPFLSVRPMLLAHIPDVIEKGTEIQYSYQLYKIMVDAWLERETAWADKDALNTISEKLAVDLYLNREKRGMERVPDSELADLARTWGIKLQKWQISGRSLLNRDAHGNYKFAHRSIMEYLFVKCLIKGHEGCYNCILTDQMKMFLIEMLSKKRPSICFYYDELQNNDISVTKFNPKTDTFEWLDVSNTRLLVERTIFQLLAVNWVLRRKNSALSGPANLREEHHLILYESQLMKDMPKSKSYRLRRNNLIRFMEDVNEEPLSIQLLIDSIKLNGGRLSKILSNHETKNSVKKHFGVTLSSDAMEYALFVDKHNEHIGFFVHEFYLETGLLIVPTSAGSNHFVLKLLDFNH